MTVNYVDLGKRIKKRREKCKMSQAELAAQAELSVQHVSNVENAKSKVGLEKLVVIANVLGCSLDELISGSMKNSKTVYRNDIGEMIEGFSEAELRILPEFLRCFRYAYKLLKMEAKEEKER